MSRVDDEGARNRGEGRPDPLKRREIDYTPYGYIIKSMDSAKRQKLQSRIKRIAGQVGGVQRMVEEDRYCVDILNQISAVRSALDALGVELLTNHVECCVLGHGTSSEHAKAKPMKPRELLDELQTALSRFLK